MLIADEVTSKAPIVLIPNAGARVRVYTLHGDAAVDSDSSEQPLAACPTSGDDWVISVPSSTEEIEWVRTSLVSLPHFVVRDLSDGIEASAEPTAKHEMVVDARWLEE